MRTIGWVSVALSVAALAAQADNTGTDPMHKFA